MLVNVEVLGQQLLARSLGHIDGIDDVSFVATGRRVLQEVGGICNEVRAVNDAPVVRIPPDDVFSVGGEMCADEANGAVVEAQPH